MDNAIFSEEHDEIVDDTEERWLLGRELMCASMSGCARRDDLRGGVQANIGWDVRDEVDMWESETLPGERYLVVKGGRGGGYGGGGGSDE